MTTSVGCLYLLRCAEAMLSDLGHSLLVGCVAAACCCYGGRPPCHCLFFWMLILLVPLSQGTGAGDDAKRISDIITWIRDNGGWISDKVEVKQIVGSLSGIFAKEALEEGEVVAEIPWELIIVPTYPEDAEWLCEMAEDLEKRLSKNPSELNPYELYLLSRSRSHVPLFWSAEGKSLLYQVYKGLPAYWSYHSIEEMCKSMLVEDSFLHALMLIQTRGDGEEEDMLVPFTDLVNHRNGDYRNVQPDIEPEKRYRIVTVRSVEPGEELQSTYNQCEWCNPMKLTTPELFEVFGFVESSPQRWLIPLFNISFDVTYGDDGELLFFDFIAAPDERGLTYLQHRLMELKRFEQENKGRTDIPKEELDGIFQFHEAVVNAFSAALEQAAEDSYDDDAFDESEGDTDDDEYTEDVNYNDNNNEL